MQGRGDKAEVDKHVVVVVLVVVVIVVVVVLLVVLVVVVVSGLSVRCRAEVPR